MSINSNGNKSQTAAEGFWKEILKFYSAPTPFVVDTNMDDSHNNSRRIEQCALDTKVWQGVVKISQKNNVSKEAIVVAMWGLLLSRYSAEEDVLFALESRYSFDSNDPVTPVSINVGSEHTILSWLKTTQKMLLDQQNVIKPGLDILQQCSNIPKHSPLFESLVVINQQEDSEQTKYVDSFPLCLTVNLGSEACIQVNYADYRFTNKTIKRLLGHLREILAAISGNNIQRLSQVTLLTKAEYQKMVVQWNQTEVDYPQERCLHQLFEHKAANSPEAVAAIFQSQQLTYGQLNEKANQLANFLKLNGAQPGQLVAISLNRGLDMVIGLMAIAKSGAAYVPLDPTYPQERLQYMMSDTHASILLTESAIVEDFPSHTAQLVLIDTHWPEIAQAKQHNLDVDVSPTDLAYVIYTSGSTGQPKGAMLNHRGRVNNFCDFNRRYFIGAGDKILALASISFDMSAYDVFGTLAGGACLVISDAAQGAANWAQLMLKHQITVWHSVPAIMEMLVDYVEDKTDLHPRQLRLVLLGGDWIPVKLPDRLKLLNDIVQVVSMGGATEVSMDSTIYDINAPSSGWKSIPYGFPMANQSTYILDPFLNPLPIGVAGELHLGGVGVGEGYLNREDLTAEKFIDNPFKQNEKLYKTGDLARFGDDGNLELLGRIDFQVKIRGFRIELGEIESCLRKHPGVNECVVLAKQDANDKKCLAAYVLSDSEYRRKNQQENNQEQIEQWQSIYDSAYSGAKDLSDETFNIVSWNSSYNDRPYPEKVMRTWVESTVSRIKKFNPKRVLEIGCGTGLLLLRIAPQCDFYHGTDISSVALEHVGEQKQKLGLSQVKLEKRSAEDFSGMSERSYDAVVLNSIVMDFPNLEYLTEVILGAAKLVTDGGIIYVGDVRNLNTLEAFHTSVQLAKARSSLDVDSFKQQIKRNAKLEEEMLKKPAYFLALKNKIPAVTGVHILHKRGNNDNEMSKFRYDVVLEVGGNKSEQALPPNWHDWQQSEMDLDQLRVILENRQGKTIALNNIPNLRVSEEYLTLKLIENSRFTKVGELRKQCKKSGKDLSAIDPEVMWELAKEFDCELDIRYSMSMDETCFDIIFQSSGLPSIVYQPMVELDDSQPLETYANNPLQAKLDRELTFELRQYLEQQLPIYMIPTSFMFLQKFPLSPNGKLNRRALPEPDHIRTDLSQEFVAPNTSVEKVLCDIWRQYLALEAVGIDDSFIALGGNSLTATQVVSKIREIFELEIPLKDCINPTVKDLAEKLCDCGRLAHLDVQETADFYLQISDLSESELEEMIS